MPNFPSSVHQSPRAPLWRGSSELSDEKFKIWRRKGKKKTRHPNPSVCNLLFWGSSVTYFPNLFAGAAAEPLLSRRYCYCRATRYRARGAIGFLVAVVCSRACFHPGAWELAEGWAWLFFSAGRGLLVWHRKNRFGSYEKVLLELDFCYWVCLLLAVSFEVFSVACLKFLLILSGVCVSVDRAKK